MLSKLYNALRSDVRTSGLDGETELDVRCVSCSRKERLLNFADLKRADHICMNGQYLVFNYGDKQVSAYTHHAIVKDINVISPSCAAISIIHFYSTPFDVSIKIRETSTLLDLHLNEVFTIRYRHPAHNAEIVIKRAEGLIEQNKLAKYSILSCNCESFCNWCCVGSEDSYQSENARDTLRAVLAGIANVGGKVLRVVCKLLMLSVEDLSKVAAGALIAVPWGVLGIMALLYLIHTIYRHYQLDKAMKAGNICSACCLRKKHDLWIQFAAYCVFQVGGLGLLSLVIAAGASSGIVFGALAVCSVLTLLCISVIPKLRQWFCSPFQGRLLRVKSLETIREGDVISFDHWKISHDGVVSAINICPNTRNKRGQITVIHYSLPSLFGRRTIVEETIKINLRKDLIFSHDYSGYNVHEPQVVVHRAKQRLGEAKFGLMTNRSCHFCHWAKVNEELNVENIIVPESAESRLLYLREIDPKDTISNLPLQSIHVDHMRGRKHASMSLEKKWARIRDEIKVGQIVEFKYRRSWHKAVSTNVHFDKRISAKVNITVVHYGKMGKVCEEKFTFNLNVEDVWVYKYHPLYRYETSDVIRRARARIGEENYNTFFHRSSHLAREIVVKEKDPVVLDIDEIKLGDVITFYYWSFRHDAIVTKVIRGDSKANTTGVLRIIHYALKDLFAVRTVSEEPMPIDLRKCLVYKKSFDGYVTYPADIAVKRARSRLHEQRFSINGNTSSDLVHWAKVVQNPIVVSKSKDDMALFSGIPKDPYLLVPKAGIQCEEFQYFRANSWSDLYPGVIVEYLYYLIWHQGILSYKDESTKTIKVIHYGADHLFATRTIMEDTMKLDLRYDNIWIYRGHPRRCYKAGVVLENARKRLGEQRWERGNRSWDFCKDCVLKKTSQEV
ncbi:uncharacterized protein LOC132730718 [Ruditapes philippinarum]|uniref:uncharacterized protein LOC132730718 n=1 Tax=Ruditapes philippinarum TaxID=129788 RepID=UPI00295B2981|nr:uncharacterized protein LOC132730718 [Ruditapes philippinarum]